MQQLPQPRAPRRRGFAADAARALQQDLGLPATSRMTWRHGNARSPTLRRIPSNAEPNALLSFHDQVPWDAIAISERAVAVAAEVATARRAETAHVSCEVDLVVRK